MLEQLVFETRFVMLPWEEANKEESPSAGDFFLISYCNELLETKHIVKRLGYIDKHFKNKT